MVQFGSRCWSWAFIARNTPYKNRIGRFDSHSSTYEHRVHILEEKKCAFESGKCGFWIVSGGVWPWKTGAATGAAIGGDFCAGAGEVLRRARGGKIIGPHCDRILHSVTALLPRTQPDSPAVVFDQNSWAAAAAVNNSTSRRSVHIREVSGALQRAFRDVTVGALL